MTEVAGTGNGNSAPYGTASDNMTFLIVSTSIQAATLTGAYMPNAALVDTNLFGVAANLHFYGAQARLDGAAPDGCTLAGANLGSSSVVVKAP